MLRLRMHNGQGKRREMKLSAIFSLLLPRKRTTEEDARQAIIACGINPDEIAWQVGADGSFAFGRNHPNATELTDAQIKCLIDWAQGRRLKLGFIGWEDGQLNGS